MKKSHFMEQHVQEFIRIKELNIELLDVLSVTIEWFIDFHKKTQINIPNLEAISFLIGKVDALLREIDSPPRMQHRFRTPTDDTEPERITLISR